MRRRLAPHWPTLWNQFGVRPMDAGELTPSEVALIEKSMKKWEQDARAEERRRRTGGR